MTMTPEILLSAAQAFPAFERLFLNATTRIDMGFRLFDPLTPLLSPEAQKIGARWHDLIVHTLNRGVTISLILSDFDPVMAHGKHSRCWHHMRILLAANEMTAPGAARLNLRAVLHPAQGGLLPRLLFALHTRRRLSRICAGMSNATDPDRALAHAPGLAPYFARANGRIVPRILALPRLYPVTLHHKLAVVDDAAVYIGGLDLNERRFDGPGHDAPAQDTWQDLQLILHDPQVVADARDYLQSLLAVISDRRKNAPHDGAFRTTLSRPHRGNPAALSPVTVSGEIVESHVRMIAGARHHIYLESQYFRDRRIAAALARAGRRTATLTLVVVLPGAPDDVAFEGKRGLDARFGEFLQARAIRKVRRAFGERFLVLSPVQPRRANGADRDDPRARLAGAPIVYTHSKVSVFDDTAAFVGSANLNGRSMAWDCEAGVELRDPVTVADLRARLWRHWCALDANEAAPDPSCALAAWRDIALENARRAPDRRQGFMVPYGLESAKDLAQAMPGAPEDMV